MPHISIRQFTYNAMLRLEVKDKIREYHLSNIQVHTYHSFTVKYYSINGNTDTGIRNIIKYDTKPRIDIPTVDLVVLDESQDMTFLYFQLIVKMARDMSTKFQLLVLGDYMQGIYEFKGADIRFLTSADNLWTILPFLKTPEFQKCTLQMSYRITNQMANFVNRDMLGEYRLKACRNGAPVVYIRRPRHQIEQIVVYQIRRLLQEGESPSDFFVLGSSVKGVNSNIRKMENALTENNIPCHVPMFETDAPDERVIDGKVVFSTFHTVKGRQRKYVFIVGFDQGYFYNARGQDTTKCPNTLYVAATRATHGLWLLENDSSRPLEFLKQTHIQMKQSEYIDFKGMPQTIFHDWEKDHKKDAVNIPTYYVTATDLIKFISEPVLEQISPIIDRIFITEIPVQNENEIDIPKIVQVRDGLYEDVSDLNGIAIPSIYYDLLCGNTDGANVLKRMIQANLQEIKPGKHGFLKESVARLPDVCATPADYLYLANVYVAVQEKLYFKLKQIDHGEYNWLTIDTVNKCMTTMKRSIIPQYPPGTQEKNNSFQERIPMMKDGMKTGIIERPGGGKGLESSEAGFGRPGVPPTIIPSLSTNEFEKQIIHHSLELEHATLDNLLNSFFGNEMKFRFSARVDLLTDNTLWELKCTSQLGMDHKLQVIIYAWLWRVLFDETMVKKEIKLLNIRTGEILRLESTMDELTRIVVALLKSKYGNSSILTDDEFIANGRDYILADTIFC